MNSGCARPRLSTLRWIRKTPTRFIGTNGNGAYKSADGGVS
jgi:hypothetical protein